MTEAPVDAAAPPDAMPDAPPERRVRVRIGGASWAVPVARVHEIIRVGAITPVPGARPAVRGLSSLRGRIVPVLDPAIVLGASPATVDADARIVIVGVGDRRIGLLVTRVDGVGPELSPPLDVDAVVEAR